MFENEVTTILNQQKNSIELLEKLHEIYKPYEYSGSKRNEIFYLDIRLENPDNVEHRTYEALNDIYRQNQLTPINSIGEKRTIEKLAEEIKNITIKDFFFSVCRYFPYGNNSKDYTFNNMTYAETRTHYKKVILILNCIWLLEHTEPVNHEIKQKLYRLSENGETFIFSGCKVTHYKNGNLKIQFSNKKLFTKFQAEFQEALKIAELKYQERNKE